MSLPDTATRFDVAASKARCKRFRRRILDISQTVPALHIAPAFSCLEIVDTIYFGLMDHGGPSRQPDTFILSKGHGAMAQYCVLEERGVLPPEEVGQSGRDGGRLGMHPDLGIPGIEASTGSLGHGLPIAVGMALADRTLGDHRTVWIVMSDGELEEGSVWEGILLAPSLNLTNLVAVIDLNDFQSLGQISKFHPNFYPMLDKILAFGWECVEVDGHDQAALHAALGGRSGRKPFMVLARTVKGKGVSYMESVPMWHYRSPNRQEYEQAIREVEAAR
jgi:transketolase